jgi:heat-inducible transcriptional repressor
MSDSEKRPDAEIPVPPDATTRRVLGPEISLRAKKILTAVVQEYLHTGDAVGSRTVTRRYGIDLSPATVRNVMSDLEDLGLLRQPHTSAGRVPTTTGLRLFIDSLLKVRSLSPKEKDDIRARYGLPSVDLDDAMQRTSRLLSELSNQAAIVITPLPERQRLKRLEFVRLREKQLLAVLVSEGGHVVNKLVSAPAGLEASDVERANNYLNELVGRLPDRTLEGVRAAVLAELGDDKNHADQLVAQALRLGEQALASPDEREVIVSGSAHLLSAAAVGGEPPELDRVRKLLVALEEKERLIGLLDRTLEADGIQVWLGAETPFAEVAEVSVVAAGYGPEDRPVGTIAVIGPTHMNYSKVIPLVDFTAELVTDLLGGGGSGR